MKVLVILGSARLIRNTPTIGRLVKEIADSVQPQVDFEIVDLKQWPIPYDAEEAIPRFGKYTSKIVQEWSAKVNSADGFVVVSPQYNWGYPAVLKHAFDVLYNEFTKKPVSIVTFGSRGGNHCNDQLREVLGGGFDMQVTDVCPKILVDRTFALTHQTDEEKLAADMKADVTECINELVEKWKQSASEEV